MWGFFQWLLGSAIEHLDGKLTTVIDNQRKILQALQAQKEILMTMKDELAALALAVQANTEVDQSAILLIQGIAAQLTAAAGDPEAVKALALQLKASTDSLAAAVVANTPVGEPTPPVEPL